MIITVYELLGLVKDFKSPNRIKYDYEIWEYDIQENDYIKEKGNCLLFRDYFPNNLNFLDCLKDKIEILEEDKPIIEKIEIEEDIVCNKFVRNEYGTKCYIKTHDKIIIEKLNQIIDYINKKENK